MQTISTVFHGPTNRRGSRIRATASGSDTYIFYGVDNALSMEENHRRACLALMAKMGWGQPMLGGDTRTGRVWVFACACDNPENVADPLDGE